MSVNRAWFVSLALSSCAPRVEHRHAAATFSLGPANAPSITLLRPLSQAAIATGVDDVRWSWRGAAGPYVLQQCVDRSCREIVAEIRTAERSARAALHPRAEWWKVCSSASCSIERMVRNSFDVGVQKLFYRANSRCDSNVFWRHSGRALSCVQRYALGGRLEDGTLISVSPLMMRDSVDLSDWQAFDDVNGDGDDDLARVFCNACGQINDRTRVREPQLFVSGHAGYSWLSEFGAAAGPTAQLESAGDLDGDGGAELIAMDTEGNVRLLRLDRSGLPHRIALPVHYEVRGALSSSTLNITCRFDLNGDGLNDVVAVSNEDVPPTVIYGADSAAFRIERFPRDNDVYIGVPVGDLTGDSVDETIEFGHALPPFAEQRLTDAPGSSRDGGEDDLVVIDGRTATAARPTEVARGRGLFESMQVSDIYRVATELDGRSLVLFGGSMRDRPRSGTPFDPTHGATLDFVEVSDRTAHQLCEVRAGSIRCLPPVYYHPLPSLMVVDVLTCLTKVRSDGCGPWRPALLLRGAIR